MGAKTWMLAYVNGSASDVLNGDPRLDREATSALAKKLFSSERLEPLEDGDLSFTCPPDNELVVGCFPGLSLIAAKEFGIDNPSTLAPKFLHAATGSVVYLHAMHSVVDWFAYAIWTDGKLKRSLSLSPRLAFEEPFWAGQHPVFDPEVDEDDDYPFPFHPLELGEAALFELFGYQLEGGAPSDVQPENITLARFKRSRSRWKFW